MSRSERRCTFASPGRSDLRVHVVNNVRVKDINKSTSPRSETAFTPDADLTFGETLCICVEVQDLVINTDLNEGV